MELNKLYSVVQSNDTYLVACTYIQQTHRSTKGFGYTTAAQQQQQWYPSPLPQDDTTTAAVTHICISMQYDTRTSTGTRTAVYKNKKSCENKVLKYYTYVYFVYNRQQQQQQQRLLLYMHTHLWPIAYRVKYMRSTSHGTWLASFRSVGLNSSPATPQHLSAVTVVNYGSLLFVPLCPCSGTANSPEHNPPPTQPHNRKS